MKPATKIAVNETDNRVGGFEFMGVTSFIAPVKWLSDLTPVPSAGATPVKYALLLLTQI